MIMRSVLFADDAPVPPAPGTPAAARAGFLGLSDAGGNTHSKSSSLK